MHAKPIIGRHSLDLKSRKLAAVEKLQQPSLSLNECKQLQFSRGARSHRADIQATVTQTKTSEKTDKCKDNYKDKHKHKCKHRDKHSSHTADIQAMVTAQGANCLGNFP